MNYYRIDLLPEELQSKPPVNPRRLLFITLTVILTAGLLTACGIFFLDYCRVSSELASLSEELSQFKREAVRLEEAKRQRLNLEKRAEKLEALIQNRRTWPEMLAEIAGAAPQEVWLTSLRLEEIKEKQSPSEKKPVAGSVSQAPAELAEEENKGRPSQEEDQETKAKSAPALPGAPNTLFVEGASYSVPAVGLFTYRLGQLPFFTKVVLTDLHSDENGGYVVFTVVASLKAGKSGAKQVE